MGVVLQRSVITSALLATAFLLTACATSAPDFHGRWHPVNRYAPEAQEIPLYPTYEFYATPMDGTLKTMLTRWASDAHMALSYEINFDFSLHAPVAKLRTASLQDALAQLEKLYAEKGVGLSLEQGRIVVRRAQVATPAR